MALRNFHIFLVLVLLTFPFPGLSQFTMEAYLNTAFDDQDLERYHSQMDFLENNNFNSPWLNRVELRVGTEDANFSMDEFRLRLSPTNPSEIKANKLYHQKQLNSLNTEYKIALNKALKNRYQLLLDHYFLSRQLRIFETKQAQNSELIKNLNLMGLQKLDAGDVISIESDISDLMLSIEEVKMEIGETVFYMALDLTAASKIDWDNISTVTIDQIRNFIDSENHDEDHENIYVREAEDNLILEQQLLKISKTEARSNIGYLQGNFDTNRGNSFEDHFGMQIGVRLPIVNPDKPDLNRDRFKLIEDEKEVDATKLLIRRRSDLLSIRLKHLFNQYDIVSERILQSSKIISSMSIKGSIDILEIIDRKNYQLDLIEKQLKIETETIDTFIDYLDINGHLAASPIKNYMSATFLLLDE